MSVWRSISIAQPDRQQFTDDRLLRLRNRAQAQPGDRLYSAPPPLLYKTRRIKCAPPNICLWCPYHVSDSGQVLECDRVIMIKMRDSPPGQHLGADFIFDTVEECVSLVFLCIFRYSNHQRLLS